jgi:AcrR family transcriptional regulator
MTKSTNLIRRKQPKQARAMVTVAAILEAAAQVFSVFGYAGTTTDKVAKRAGVSIGTLYQYFPNKDTLLLELACQHMEEGFELIYKQLNHTVVDRKNLRPFLENFISAFLDLHRDNPALHRVLFHEAPLPPAFYEEKRARELVFANTFAEALAPLGLHDNAVRAPLTYILVQAVEGLIHSYIMFPPGNVDEEILLAQMTDMLANHIATVIETQN